MSGASPANRAAVALDRTISDPMPANDVVMASGRLNARKSMSGSGRKTRKGRTTTRVSARAIARGSWPSRLRTAFSSFAMAWAETGRPSGFFASARRMTRSTAATAGEPARAGGCSVSVALTTASTVRPPNAGRPASISNRMAPTAKRSERASTGFTGDQLGRHVSRCPEHGARASDAVERILAWSAVRVAPDRNRGA